MIVLASSANCRADRIGLFVGKGATAITKTAIMQPHSIALAPDGSVVIADQYHARIIRVTRSGEVIRIAGTGKAGALIDESNPLATQLNYPDAVAIDNDGSILISDTFNNRVLLLSPQGDRIEQLAGTGKGSSHVDYRDPLKTDLWFPAGVAFDSTGYFLGDWCNSRILHISRDRSSVRVVYPTNAPDSPRLLTPSHIRPLPNGAILVSDTRMHRVLEIWPPTGEANVVAGTGTNGATLVTNSPTQTQLNEPSDVEVGYDGSIFISDTKNNRVLRVTPNRDHIELFPSTSSYSAQPTNENDTVFKPTGICALPNGSLLVGDQNRVLLMGRNQPEELRTLAARSINQQLANRPLDLQFKNSVMKVLPAELKTLVAQPPISQSLRGLETATIKLTPSPPMQLILIGE